jgi:glycosyltransferase involved in cell wall biosynthesis/GT2 family glycosyltransferase
MKTLILSNGRSGSKFITKNIIKIYQEKGLNPDVVFEPLMWSERVNEKGMDGLDFDNRNLDQEAIYYHTNTPIFDNINYDYSKFINFIKSRIEGKEHLIAKFNRGLGRINLLIDNFPWDKIIYLYNNPLSVLSRLIEDNYNLDGTPMHHRSNFESYLVPDIIKDDVIINEILKISEITPHHKNLVIWYVQNKYFIEQIIQRKPGNLFLFNLDCFKFADVATMGKVYRFFDSHYHIKDAVRLEKQSFTLKTPIPDYNVVSFINNKVLPVYFDNLNKLTAFPYANRNFDENTIDSISTIFGVPAQTPKISEKKNILTENNIMKTEEKLPTFSIIIPTYNRSEVLLECLTALAEQNFPMADFEVIIIDDGSSDGTADAVKSFAAPYKLSYLHQQNAGPGAARNHGISQAKGEFILIINDDAILEKDCLLVHSEVQKKIRGRKLAVLGTFDYWKEGLQNPFTFLLQNSSLVFAYNIMENAKIYNYRFFWTCNISLPRQALLDVGGFDENFSEPMMEDTELGYRLQKMGWAVLYTDLAKSEHIHTLTHRDYERRQRMLGRNLMKFLLKHPEMQKQDSEIFGFESITPELIPSIEEILEKADANIEDVRTFFNEIEKIKIYNPNFISLGADVVFKKEDFIKILLNKANFLHIANFYAGALEALKQNFSQDFEIDTDDELPEFIEDEITNIIFEERIPAEDPQEEFQLDKIDIEPKDISYDDDIDIEDVSFTKPKILLTMFGWNESGGGTMFPKAVAKRFAGLGYEVAVFYAGLTHSVYTNPYYLEESLDSGVKLYGVYNRRKNFIMESLPELEISDERVVKLFSDILDDFKPDVVHYFNFLGLSFAIADEVKKRNIPSFYSPENYHLLDPALYMFTNDLQNWQGTDFFKNSELNKKYPQKAALYNDRSEKALDLLNNRIDYTLSISKRVKEIFVDFGADPSKISIVHQIPYTIENAEKAQNSNKSNSKIKFAFIGTLIPHKGVHKIFEAIQLLSSDNYEMHVFGFGSDIYMQELKKMAGTAEVHWHGGYKGRDLPDLLQDIDIAIIPSIWEECAGLVVLEALALGIPVIISRIGGMTDFIRDGRNGFTYPHNSARNLAAIMQMLLDFPDTVEHLKSNAKCDLTFTDYIHHLSKLYDKATAGKQMSITECGFMV